MMMTGEWREDFEVIVKDKGIIETLWLVQVFFEITNVSYEV